MHDACIALVEYRESSYPQRIEMNAQVQQPLFPSACPLEIFMRANLDLGGAPVSNYVQSFK